MKKQDTRCYHEGNFKHGCTDETTKVNPKKKRIQNYIFENTISLNFWVVGALCGFVKISAMF